MEHKHVTSQEEYDFFADRIEQIISAAEGSEEEKELKILTKLILEFEAQSLFISRLKLQSNI